MTFPPFLSPFLRFAQILRERGFRTPAGTSELFRALSLIHLERKREVYLALKAVLLSEPEREEEFARIFEGFFTSLPPPPPVAPQSPFPPQGEQGLSGEDPLALWEYLEEVAGRSGLVGSKVPLGEGYARYKLWKRLEEEGVLSQLLERKGGEENALQALRSFVEEFVRKELRYREVSELPKKSRSDLYERSFYHIPPDELPLILHEVERLARRLRHLYSRRLERGAEGRMDLPRTLRKNMESGGVLFHLHFRKPRVQKFELALFVDVSASVRTASSFMLTFSYAFQELFQRVRSFAFVTECVEITEPMRRHSLSRFIQEVMEGRILDIWEDSDYGRFFASVEALLPRLITPRTTVLILGDARSNYHDPRVDCLRNLASKARTVLWFNPEPEGSWGFGDSVIHSYAPFCGVVAPVGNLRMLMEAVDRYVIPRTLPRKGKDARYLATL